VSTRHKAVKTTLEKGYASEWNDDHESNFNTWINHEYLRPGPDLTAEWDIAQVVGASTVLWAMTANHAAVELVTPANTDDIATMRLELGAAVSNVTHPDDLPIMTFGLDIDTVHDAAGVANSVVEIGFQDDSDALFTVNQHHAIFRVYNGNLYGVTGDGAAETETLIAAYSQYGQYRIEILSDRVKFYVDDMVNAAATNTTHNPAADLTMKFSVRSKNNTASTIRIDGLALARLRKQ